MKRIPPETSDLDFARHVLRSEGEVILRLIENIGDPFRSAVDLVLALKGRVVVTGMGKAGLVGQKIASTLASTGTPSFFLHPSEALHGDLGMVSSDDAILALSNSGETEEVVRLLPHVSRRLPILAITRDAESPLGREADLVLALGDIEEACPLGLAPSASTTAMLALGDALALTVERRRGFSDEDFARFHPSGSLGKKFQRVAEVMRRDARLPLVSEETTVAEAINRITRARAGSAVVVGTGGELRGIFTDGDFRRNWGINPQIGRDPVKEYMTSPCLHVSDLEFVNAARKLMASRRINELPVVDGEGQVVGLLDIQDIVT